MPIDDRGMEFLDEDLPINVLPYSNEEFLPASPSPEQLLIHRMATEECAEAAARHGMSRRRFLRTGAAAAITVSAIARVWAAKAGNTAYARTDPLKACDLDYPNAQMNNLPGEFVMDLQTHHVDSGGTWRITNPGEAAFFAAIWAQSNCGEVDREECLGRYHYLKALFLDSSTNVTILSAVPYKPDGQPLPIERAAETCGIVKSLAGNTHRAYMHRFVMPNRGSVGHNSDSILGPAGVNPLFMREEFELMEYSAAAFGEYLRAWKVYCPWGDVPNTSGWWLDDPVGLQFLEKVRDIGDRYRMPKLICAHKGFALPTFDQEKAATRDVGRVAPMFPDIDFIIYHSGYDGDGIGLGGPLNQGTSTRGPYPYDIAPDGSFRLGAGDESDAKVRSIDRGVDNLIKALRENGWSARHDPGIGGRRGVPMAAGDGDPTLHGNTANVFAELGSVWGSVQSNPKRASYLLGKLIYYVGPRRVVWGTDSLWGGSPQGQIVAFRSFGSPEPLVEGETGRLPFDPAIMRLYNLPFGLDGDVDDPTMDTRSPDSYAAGHPRLPGWPTDGRAHPERSIRNGVLGRNAAVPYRIDPDATLEAISCDDVQRIRDEYILNPMTPHSVNGARTPAGVLAGMKEDPWHNGAILRQNSNGFLKL